MSTAMENQKIVSYVFYSDGIVLFPYPRMSLGRHFGPAKKGCPKMKYCVFVDVFQDSVDLNLTILCNRFFFL